MKLENTEEGAQTHSDHRQGSIVIEHDVDILYETISSAGIRRFGSFHLVPVLGMGSDFKSGSKLVKYPDLLSSAAK